MSVDLKRAALGACAVVLALSCGNSDKTSSGPGPAAGTGAAGDAGTSGSAGTGGAGAAGTAGAAGAACSAGMSGAGDVPPAPELTGDPTRPLLTDASAADYTIAKYLAQAGQLPTLTTDNWDPTAGLGDVSAFTPTYTVAADGSGTHPTVQAAIDAAIAAGGTDRVYILVKPGSYREVVCAKSANLPITIYGADADATLVEIVFNNYASKPTDTSVNPCKPPSAGAATYGTSASATFAAFAPGFQLKNLTIANDFGADGQAVALMAQGDQQVFENVRLLGLQDTFYIPSPTTLNVTRAYVKDSYIEGTTDFIFGRATVVLDGCTLNYKMVKPNTLLAPSTAAKNVYGMLVINSTLSADPGTADNVAHLGRAWDESVGCYQLGVSPNGQAVIRDSVIGSFLNVSAPWIAAATTARAFDGTENRLWEYNNSGPGAAPSDGAAGAPDMP